MRIVSSTKSRIRQEPSVYTLANSGFYKNFLYQGGVKSTVSWVFEDLKFKISEGYDQNWCFPDWAQSGKVQFWSESSEILNLRSSTTPETVASSI